MKAIISTDHLFDTTRMIFKFHYHRLLPQKKIQKQKNYQTMSKSFLTVEKQTKMQKEKKQTAKDMNYKR